MANRTLKQRPAGMAPKSRNVGRSIRDLNRSGATRNHAKENNRRYLGANEAASMWNSGQSFWLDNGNGTHSFVGPNSKYVFTGASPDTLDYAQTSAMYRMTGANQEQYDNLSTNITSPGTTYYDPYFNGASTQTAEKEFFKSYFGHDVTFDEKFFTDNVNLRQYVNRQDDAYSSGTGSIIKPGKKATQEEWAGYYYERLYMGQANSIETNKEYDDYRADLENYYTTFKFNNGRAPTLEEFNEYAKITKDDSRYGMLYKMDASRNLDFNDSAAPLLLNDGCYYSRESIPGLYSVLSNGGSISENRSYLEDAIEYWYKPYQKREHVYNALSEYGLDPTDWSYEEWDNAKQEARDNGDWKLYQTLDATQRYYYTDYADYITTDQLDYFGEGFGYIYDDDYITTLKQRYEPIWRTMIGPNTSKPETPKSAATYEEKAAYQAYFLVQNWENDKILQSEREALFEDPGVKTTISELQNGNMSVEDALGRIEIILKREEFDNIRAYRNGKLDTDNTYFLSNDDLTKYLTSIRNGDAAYGNSTTNSGIVYEDHFSEEVEGGMDIPEEIAFNAINDQTQAAQQAKSDVNGLSEALLTLNEPESRYVPMTPERMEQMGITVSCPNNLDLMDDGRLLLYIANTIRKPNTLRHGNNSPVVPEQNNVNENSDASTETENTNDSASTSPAPTPSPQVTPDPNKLNGPTGLQPPEWAGTTPAPTQPTKSTNTPSPETSASATPTPSSTPIPTPSLVNGNVSNPEGNVVPGEAEEADPYENGDFSTPLTAMISYSHPNMKEPRTYLPLCGPIAEAIDNENVYMNATGGDLTIENAMLNIMFSNKDDFSEAVSSAKSAGSFISEFMDENPFNNIVWNNVYDHAKENGYTVQESAEAALYASVFLPSTQLFAYCVNGANANEYSDAANEYYSNMVEDPKFASSVINAFRVIKPVLEKAAEDGYEFTDKSVVPETFSNIVFGLMSDDYTYNVKAVTLMNDIENGKISYDNGLFDNNFKVYVTSEGFHTSNDDFADRMSVTDQNGNSLFKGKTVGGITYFSLNNNYINEWKESEPGEYDTYKERYNNPYASSVCDNSTFGNICAEAVAKYGPAQWYGNGKNMLNFSHINYGITQRLANGYLSGVDQGSVDRTQIVNFMRTYSDCFSPEQIKVVSEMWGSGAITTEGAMNILMTVVGSYDGGAYTARGMKNRTQFESYLEASKEKAYANVDLHGDKERTPEAEPNAPTPTPTPNASPTPAPGATPPPIPTSDSATDAVNQYDMAKADDAEIQPQRLAMPSADLLGPAGKRTKALYSKENVDALYNAASELGPYFYAAVNSYSIEDWKNNYGLDFGPGGMDITPSEYADMTFGKGWSKPFDPDGVGFIKTINTGITKVYDGVLDLIPTLHNITNRIMYGKNTEAYDRIKSTESNQHAEFNANASETEKTFEGVMSTVLGMYASNAIGTGVLSFYNSHFVNESVLAASKLLYSNGVRATDFVGANPRYGYHNIQNTTPLLTGDAPVMLASPSVHRSVALNNVISKAKDLALNVIKYSPATLQQSWYYATKSALSSTNEALIDGKSISSSIFRGITKGLLALGMKGSDARMFLSSKTMNYLSEGINKVPDTLINWAFNIYNKAGNHAAYSFADSEIDSIFDSIEVIGEGINEKYSFNEIFESFKSVIYDGTRQSLETAKMSAISAVLVSVMADIPKDIIFSDWGKAFASVKGKFFDRVVIDDVKGNDSEHLEKGLLHSDKSMSEIELGVNDTMTVSSDGPYNELELNPEKNSTESAVEPGNYLTVNGESNPEDATLDYVISNLIAGEYESQDAFYVALGNSLKRYIPDTGNMPTYPVKPASGTFEETSNKGLNKAIIKQFVERAISETVDSDPEVVAARKEIERIEAEKEIKLGELQEGLVAANNNLDACTKDYDTVLQTVVSSINSTPIRNNSVVQAEKALTAAQAIAQQAESDIATYEGDVEKRIKQQQKIIDKRSSDIRIQIEENGAPAEGAFVLGKNDYPTIPDRAPSAGANTGLQYIDGALQGNQSPYFVGYDKNDEREKTSGTNPGEEKQTREIQHYDLTSENPDGFDYSEYKASTGVDESLQSLDDYNAGIISGSTAIAQRAAYLENSEEDIRNYGVKVDEKTYNAIRKALKDHYGEDSPMLDRFTRGIRAHEGDVEYNHKQGAFVPVKKTDEARAIAQLGYGGQMVKDLGFDLIQYTEDGHYAVFKRNSNYWGVLAESVPEVSELMQTRAGNYRELNAAKAYKSKYLKDHKGVHDSSDIIDPDERAEFERNQGIIDTMTGENEDITLRLEEIANNYYGKMSGSIVIVDVTTIGDAIYDNDIEQAELNRKIDKEVEEGSFEHMAIKAGFDPYSDKGNTYVRLSTQNGTEVQDDMLGKMIEKRDAAAIKLLFPEGGGAVSSQAKEQYDKEKAIVNVMREMVGQELSDQDYIDLTNLYYADFPEEEVSPEEEIPDKDKNNFDGVVTWQFYGTGTPFGESTKDFTAVRDELGGLASRGGDFVDIEVDRGYYVDPVVYQIYNDGQSAYAGTQNVEPVASAGKMVKAGKESIIAALDGADNDTLATYSNEGLGIWSNGKYYHRANPTDNSAGFYVPDPRKVPNTNVQDEYGNFSLAKAINLARSCFGAKMAFVGNGIKNDKISIAVSEKDPDTGKWTNRIVGRYYPDLKGTYYPMFENTGDKVIRVMTYGDDKNVVDDFVLDMSMITGDDGYITPNKYVQSVLDSVNSFNMTPGELNESVTVYAEERLAAIAKTRESIGKLVREGRIGWNSSQVTEALAVLDKEEAALRNLDAIDLPVPDSQPKPAVESHTSDTIMLRDEPGSEQAQIKAAQTKAKQAEDMLAVFDYHDSKAALEEFEEKNGIKDGNVPEELQTEYNELNSNFEAAKEKLGITEDSKPVMPPIGDRETWESQLRESNEYLSSKNTSDNETETTASAEQIVPTSDTPNMSEVTPLDTGNPDSVNETVKANNSSSDVGDTANEIAPVSATPSDYSEPIQPPKTNIQIDSSLSDAIENVIPNNEELPQSVESGAVTVSDLEQTISGMPPLVALTYLSEQLYYGNLDEESEKIAREAYDKILKENADITSDRPVLRPISYAAMDSAEGRIKSIETEIARRDYADVVNELESLNGSRGKKNKARVKELESEKERLEKEFGKENLENTPRTMISREALEADLTSVKDEYESERKKIFGDNEDTHVSEEERAFQKSVELEKTEYDLMTLDLLKDEYDRHGTLNGKEATEEEYNKILDQRSALIGKYKGLGGDLANYPQYARSPLEVTPDEMEAHISSKLYLHSVAAVGETPEAKEAIETMYSDNDKVEIPPETVNKIIMAALSPKVKNNPDLQEDFVDWNDEAPEETDPFEQIYDGLVRDKENLRSINYSTISEDVPDITNPEELKKVMSVIDQQMDCANSITKILDSGVIGDGGVLEPSEIEDKNITSILRAYPYLAGMTKRELISERAMMRNLAKENVRYINNSTDGAALIDRYSAMNFSDPVWGVNMKPHEMATAVLNNVRMPDGIVGAIPASDLAKAIETAIPEIVDGSMDYTKVIGAYASVITDFEKNNAKLSLVLDYIDAYFDPERGDKPVDLNVLARNYANRVYPHTNTKSVTMDEIISGYKSNNADSVSGLVDEGVAILAGVADSVRSLDLRSSFAMKEAIKSFIDENNTSIAGYKQQMKGLEALSVKDVEGILTGKYGGNLPMPILSIFYGAIDKGLMVNNKTFNKFANSIKTSLSSFFDLKDTNALTILGQNGYIINQAYVQPVLNAGEKIRSEAKRIRAELDEHVPENYLVPTKDGARQLNEILPDLIESRFKLRTSPGGPTISDDDEYIDTYMDRLGIPSDDSTREFIRESVEWYLGFNKWLFDSQNTVLARNGSKTLKLINNGWYVHHKWVNRDFDEDSAKAGKYDNADSKEGISTRLTIDSPEYDTGKTKLNTASFSRSNPQNGPTTDIRAAINDNLDNQLINIYQEDNIQRIIQMLDYIKGEIKTDENGTRLMNSKTGEPIRYDAPIEHALGSSGNVPGRGTVIGNYFERLKSAARHKNSAINKGVQSIGDQKFAGMFKDANTLVRSAKSGFNIPVALTSGSRKLFTIFATNPIQTLIAIPEVLFGIGDAGNREFVDSRNAVAAPEQATGKAMKKLEKSSMSLLSLVDQFTADVTYRALYNKYKGEGDSPEQADARARNRARHMCGSNTFEGASTVKSNYILNLLLGSGQTKINTFRYFTNDNKYYNGTTDGLDRDTRKARRENGIESSKSITGPVKQIFSVAIYAALASTLVRFLGKKSMPDAVSGIEEGIDTYKTAMDEGKGTVRASYDAITTGVDKAFSNYSLFSDDVALFSSVGDAYEAMSRSGGKLFEFVTDVIDGNYGPDDDSYEMNMYDLYRLIRSTAGNFIPGGTAAIDFAKFNFDYFGKGYSTDKNGGIEGVYDGIGDYATGALFGYKATKPLRQNRLGETHTLTGTDKEVFKRLLASDLDPKEAFEYLQPYQQGRIDANNAYQASRDATIDSDERYASAEEFSDNSMYKAGVYPQWVYDSSSPSHYNVTGDACIRANKELARNSDLSLSNNLISPRDIPETYKFDEGDYPVSESMRVKVEKLYMDYCNDASEKFMRINDPTYKDAVEFKEAMNNAYKNAFDYYETEIKRGE